MTAPNFGPNDIMVSLWGDMSRNMKRNPVSGQMMPGDAFIMYDGAQKAHYPWAQLTQGGWYAWDMRGTLFTFAHDLMRFRPLTDVATFDPTIEHGLYDWVLYGVSLLQKLTAGK